MYFSNRSYYPKSFPRFFQSTQLFAGEMDNLRDVTRVSGTRSFKPHSFPASIKL